MSSEALHVAVWLIGIITAMLLFLVPISNPALLPFFFFFRFCLLLSMKITFKKIICSKSIQEFSGIPYVLTLLNCLITGWYSIFSPGSLLVFTVNMTGAGLELIYVIIFIVIAQKREKGKILAILVLVLALFGAVSLLSVFAFEWKSSRLFCGFAMVMSSIAMYVSPFSVTRMVIKTKSTEFMPFFLSLFVFLYAISWFIVGLLEKDHFLSVANGLGTGLGIIQLILYASYRNNPAEKYKFAKGSLELGLPQTQLEKQSDVNPVFSIPN